ncbi:F-box/LRR-repeat protein 2-like [Mytilus edulis]|uniref:F-box/LRR-repeat protein 2-like n=1 Tax=Mytilus edulis TaxID=6550 RepID=UPI0039EE2615
MAYKMPSEVITHIMRYLSVADRKDAALVNKVWYDASLDPILQRDIVIHFYGTMVESRFPNLSRRKMSNLMLDQFDSSLESKSIMLKSCQNFSQSLRNLSLKGSNITDSLFVDLMSHCKNLVHLDLSSCNSLFMSGRILELNDDIQKLKDTLKNVKVLNLSSIRFLSDATFNRMVTVCSNVESVHLASAQITFISDSYLPKGQTNCVSNSLLTFGNILHFIETQQDTLKALDFTRTGISDDPLDQIASIQNLELEEIVLTGCKDVSDEGINSLCKNQKHLRIIEVKGCTEISGAALELITQNLMFLEILRLGKCRQLNDIAVRNLHQLRCLQVLDLSEIYQLTSAGLIKGLCHNVNEMLTHINFNCCSNVKDNFVVSLCKAAPNLLHLDLGSTGITNISVQAVCKYLKFLRYFRVAWCREITDLALVGYKDADKDIIEKAKENPEDFDIGRLRRIYDNHIIFKKPTGFKKDQLSASDLEKLAHDTTTGYTLDCLGHLHDLDLSACKMLTDGSLVHVIKFKELRSLSLCMTNITDITVSAVAAKNPSLEHICLSQCLSITDDAIRDVTKRLTRLSSLDIAGCDNLTDKSIHHIQMNCKRLKSLDVSFCKKISPESVGLLETNMKTIQSVNKRLTGN